MGETMQETKALGKFVWHDLMTTDPARARAFYSALVGWSYNEVDMGTYKYPMIHAAGADHGGIVNLSAAAGLPSHWVCYVTVDDVDAAAAKAGELGGRVPEGGRDIPGVGRFAAIVSPGGAVICPYKPNTWGGEGYDGPGRPGTFVWHELLALDPEAEGRFFGAIFGWTTQAMDMGPMGTYHLFKRPDRPEKDAAGMMKKPEGSGPSAWLPYIGVEDVDATFAKVEPLGGTVWVKPTDIPNVGRFAVVSDPTGATFALYR
jgi:predicted enzyme related to lactoylglutathione lyase